MAIHRFEHPYFTLRASRRSFAELYVPSDRVKPLAPLILSLTLAFGAFAMPVLPAQAASGQADASRASFQIPPGPLSSALSLFASETGSELAVDSALLRGKQSNGLSGRYTVSEGFAELLRGHGLQAVGNAMVGYKVMRMSEDEDGQTVLPAVTVVASKLGGATEDSGVYTTNSSAAAIGMGLSLRETPQSVSVITRQRLDDQAVQSVQEILHIAPGITVTQLDSERFNFYSRGFPIDNLQYDGVPTQYTTQYGAGETEVDSILYDRVEIVRGATGLLTGAGDPSAAINLVRKHADSRVFSGTLSAGTASWDNYRASADLSTPLTHNGRVRGRLIAAEEKKKSHIDGYERERQTFYGVVDADLAVSTALSLGASYQKGRANGVTYGGFPLVYSDGGAIDWRSHGRSFSIWPRWSTEDTDSYNAFAQLEHRWSDDWKTTALAMYSRQHVDNARLFPWGFPDPDTGLMSSSPSRVKFPGARTQRSLDVRTDGRFLALGRAHEAILGASYSIQKSDFDRSAASDAAPSISLFDWEQYPEPAAWGASVKSETYERRQTGLYGALRLSLADPLKVIVGGRLNRWDRSGAGYMGRNPYDFRKTKFTPYAGLVYDLNEAYSVYGSYTTIYNPQNYQDRNGNFLDPIEGENWEAGVKGEFLDGRVQASLALFRIKQDNVAQADAGQYVPGTTTQAYAGASGVVSKGVEFELNGELTPGWNLSFNAAHFQARDAQGAKVNTASPRTVLRLFSTYRLPGVWNRLTVGGGLNWQSKTTNVTGVYHTDNPNGQGEYGQGAYLLANVMARYEFNKHLSLQLNVDNLFDKWYYSSVNFDEQLMWGTPRNYRATLTYKF